MAGKFGSPSGTHSDDDLITGINVTPLVDVVLVLLIIFMMTAPMIFQSAIKIQLPQAKNGEKPNQSPLTFTLTKDGIIQMNQEILAWDQIPVRLKAHGTDTTQHTAIISADQATPHGLVIRLMDSLRGAGITHFALNVDGSLRSNSTN